MAERGNPEAKIQKSIMEFIQTAYPFIDFWEQKSKGSFHKGRFLKRMSRFARKGLPDILGIWPSGHWFACEVKCDGKYATPEQKAFIEMINMRGGTAFVARSVLEAEAYIKSALTIRPQLREFPKYWFHPSKKEARFQLPEVIAGDLDPLAELPL